MKIKNNGYSFLFIIIYTLIFIVIVNGFNLVNKWQYQIKHGSLRDNYYNCANIYNWCETCLETAEYSEDGSIIGGSRVCDKAVHEEMAQKILTKLYDKNVSIYISSWVKINGTLKDCYVYFAFSYDNPWFYNIIEGRNLKKKDFETHSKVAIISENIKDMVIKKNDEYYINVGGILYNVVGIYEAANVELMEDVVVAYFPDTEKENSTLCKVLGDGIWLGQRGIEIYIGSDDEDEETVYEKAKSISEEINSIKNVSSKAVKWPYIQENGNGVSEEIKLLGILNGVLLVFCLICYMQTISVFTVKKQKDYTIYRVCGCSNLRISVEILKELVPLLICSIVITVIFNVFYNIFISKKVFYSITAESICYVVLVVIMILIISICCILRKITRINLVEGIMDL